MRRRLEAGFAPLEHLLSSSRIRLRCQVPKIEPQPCDSPVQLRRLREAAQRRAAERPVASWWYHAPAIELGRDHCTHRCCDSTLLHRTANLPR